MPVADDRGSRSPGSGRHRLPTEDRVPVEGDPATVRQWLGTPSAVSGVAQAGVFHIFFAEMVHYYDDRVGVDLKWCSLDSASVKAPKGGTIRAPIRPIAQNSAQNATF